MKKFKKLTFCKNVQSKKNSEILEEPNSDSSGDTKTKMQERNI